MKFIEGTSTSILEGGVTVKTFELEHTGLGYYVNPKPAGNTDTTASVRVDGGATQTLTITHESDMHDWYCVFHLRSCRSVGLLFFSESQAQEAVQQLAPLANWTLDADALLSEQEEMKLVGQKIQDIRWKTREASV